MGIYIPNMEMPRKGQMLVIFPDGTSYVCFNGMRERLTQTTAIPVPDHGRLVDATEMFEYFVIEGQRSKRYKLGEKWELNGEEIRKVIAELPTVIPASREE